MKLIFGIFLIIYMQLSLAGNKIFLSNAIKTLSSEEVQIVYSNDFINANEIELNSIINSIEELSHYLNTINYQLFEIKNSVYLIKPIQTNSQVVEQRTIIGRTIDGDSNKQILGAQVFVNDNTKPQAINNFSGFAIINLKSEIYNLTIKAPGYITQKFVVDLTESKVTSKILRLKSAPIKLENILVTTSLFDFYKLEEGNQSVMAFNEMESTPHLGNDPSRAVTKIPGLTSNGISARYHARGGKQNESQVLLNGLPLRNPYHFKDFFGVFSTINLSYVEELSVFAGVFPTKYGNYISSVMDVESKSPSEDFFVDFSIGSLNSYITLGDSLNSGLKYIVSYRSGGDLFRSGLIEVDVGDPSYDDFFFNISNEFPNGIKINGNILHSKDTINLNLVNEDEVAVAKYIDNNYWGSISIPATDKLTVNTMAFYQTNKTNRLGELFDDEIQGSLFEKRNTATYGVSSNINYQFNENSLITFGTNIQKEKTDIEYNTIYSGNDFIGLILNPNEIDFSRFHRFKNTGYSSSVYSNFRYKFNHKLSADFGLRFDKQNWTESNQLSPRLNFSYHINESSILRFGLGRHFQQQLIDGILLEDSTLKYFEPEAANIGIVEFQKQINSQSSFRFELYYKKYTEVQPYYENLFIGLHLHPELFTDRMRIKPDSAFSKGIDFSFSQSGDKHDWSISYSFSEVKDIFAGNEVLRSWDQKNAIKYSHNWYFGNWQYGSLLQYHSGWPKTMLYQNNIGEIIVGSRNTDRNKDFLNLDLRVSYDSTYKNTKIKYWFQLNNALNKDNQCCSEFSYEENENGEFILLNEQKRWLPILPSLGINITF